MKNKHSFQDRIIISIVVPLLFINIVYNSVAGYWAVYDIILRIVGLIIYVLTIYFYKKVFKSDFYLWLFTVCLSYLILI